MGGIERVSYEVITRLARKHKVAVLAQRRWRDATDMTEPEQYAIKTAYSFNVPKTNFWTFFYLISKRRLVKKMIKEFRPDVIYAHNPYDTYVSLDLGIPVVSHIHSLYTNHFMSQESSRTLLPALYWKWFWNYRLNIEKTALSKSNLVITYSDFLGDLAKERGAKNVIIIPNGINVEVFYPSGRKSEDIKKPAVIYVGRIEQVKGIEYLIKAAEKLPQINFYLIGEVKDKYTFPKNVIILGKKRPVEIPEYLRSADIFLNPVIRDGFEIVNIEAMACGIPVVTTDAFERSTLYKDFAMLIPPHDAEQIVNAINRLMTNNELRDHLIKSGLAMATNYDWSRIIELVEQQLEGTYKNR